MGPTGLAFVTTCPPLSVSACYYLLQLCVTYTLCSCSLNTFTPTISPTTTAHLSSTKHTNYTVLSVALANVEHVAGSVYNMGFLKALRKCMYVAVIKVLALPMINIPAHTLMQGKFVSDAEILNRQKMSKTL